MKKKALDLKKMNTLAIAAFTNFPLMCTPGKMPPVNRGWSVPVSILLLTASSPAAAARAAQLRQCQQWMGLGRYG